MTTTVISPPEQVNSTTPSVERTVVDVLHGLTENGNTSDAVADFLRAAGVKGIQLDACTCPLANLLSELPDVEQIEVIDDHVYVWGAGPDATIIDLPAPVSEFVTRFDAGVYLDLVELPAVSR